MKRKAIPEQTKQWADAVIQEFNESVIRDPNRYFTARYRGNYLYLDRMDYGPPRPRCRLTYTGSPDRWEFAIFKYSDECYDPGEWFFPGAQYVDGTLLGALKAARGRALVLDANTVDANIPVTYTACSVKATRRRER